MANLLDALYLIALAVTSPYLAWQRYRYGKYRRGWWQKWTGQLPTRRSAQPCAWMHAVSVGEVLLLRPFLAQLRCVYPHWQFVLTVGTETGFDVARQTFPDLTVAFAPFDFSWAIRQAFDRLRPNLVLLAELELWPNWLHEAARRRVPVAVINARLSERSFRGYRRLGRLFVRYTDAVQVWAVQNQTYAQRLRQLGVPPDRIFVTGSMKLDGVNTDRCNPRTQELARLFGLAPPNAPSRPEIVWVAGSTQEPEERIVLRIYERLWCRWPQLRLILVPRHRERFDTVAQLIEQHGWPVLRRSHLAANPATIPGEDASAKQAVVTAYAGSRHDSAQRTHRPAVILVDTIGELAYVWGLADIAFVGGSFGDRGGQNMLEPAALGVPVLFGPNVWNFQEIADQLCHAQAAWQASSPEHLESLLAQLLAEPQTRLRLGQRARQWVLASQGAVLRTLDVLRPLFRGYCGRAAA